MRILSVALGVCCLGILLLAGSAVLAGGEGPKKGDPAPKFHAKDDTGKVWKSSEHVGKKILVVYFYPADLTGGCTKQACGFRDDLGKLTDMGVEVVGVSGDSVKNHQLFKKVHKLNFTLLADEDGAVAKKFGVPFKEGPFTFKYKDSEGEIHALIRGGNAARQTFVIDKQGKIALRNTSVNAAQDSQKVLETVKNLESK
jgi:peroxiredoxin Q/BCP